MPTIENNNTYSGGSGSGSDASSITSNPGAQRYFIGDKNLDELYPLYDYCSKTYYQDKYHYQSGGASLPILFNTYPGDGWNIRVQLPEFKPIITVAPGSKPCFRNGTSYNTPFFEQGGAEGSREGATSGATLSYKLYKEDNRLKIKSLDSNVMVFNQPASYFRDKVLPRRILFLGIGGGGSGAYNSLTNQGGSAGCWVFGALDLDVLINNSSSSYYILTIGRGGYYKYVDEEYDYHSYEPQSTSIKYGPSGLLAVSIGQGKNGVNSESFNTTTTTIFPGGPSYTSNYAWTIDYGIGASGGYGTGIGGNRHPGSGVSYKSIYATSSSFDKSLNGNIKTLSGGDGGVSHNNDGGGGGGASILASGGNGAAGRGGSMNATGGKYGSGGGGEGYHDFGKDGGQGYLALWY